MKNLSQISVILMKHLSHFGHLRLAGMLSSSQGYVTNSLDVTNMIEVKVHVAWCILMIFRRSVSVK